MTWGKMDDKFHRNRKVRELRRAKGGREALGVWVFWWSWVLDDPELTGVVPAYELDAAEEKSAELLVSSGLWDRVEEGYRYHDFHDYNPTREQVDAKREADRSRVANKRGASRSNVARDSDATNQRVASTRDPDPTRPVPNPESASALSAREAPPPEAPTPRHPTGVRAESLRTGYVERFQRAMPGIGLPSVAGPGNGGPWLEVAREVTDEQVAPLLDAFFADCDPFVAKDRAPSKLVGQRVRLLTQGPTQPRATARRGTEPMTHDEARAFVEAHAGKGATVHVQKF